jgi:hypothetical protein
MSFQFGPFFGLFYSQSNTREFTTIESFNVVRAETIKAAKIELGEKSTQVMEQ